MVKQWHVTWIRGVISLKWKLAIHHIPELSREKKICDICECTFTRDSISAAHPSPFAIDSRRPWCRMDSHTFTLSSLVSTHSSQEQKNLSIYDDTASFFVPSSFSRCALFIACSFDAAATFGTNHPLFRQWPWLLALTWFHLYHVNHWPSHWEPLLEELIWAFFICVVAGGSNKQPWLEE
jgi:hypothetical protein